MSATNDDLFEQICREEAAAGETVLVARTNALPPGMASFDLYKPRDADETFEEWGANCGPASLAAMAGVPINSLRQHLGDFPKRRYMNPTHMVAACASIGLRIDGKACRWPTVQELALVFIQWGGPWLKPGVPIGAAYRNTHWIALAHTAAYDVNVGHWIHRADWVDPHGGVAAEIMKRVPRCDGNWTVRAALLFTVRDICEFRRN